MVKKNPLYKSFGYAFTGIFACIKKERNMKIHCSAVILVTIGVNCLNMIYSIAVINKWIQF